MILYEHMTFINFAELKHLSGKIIRNIILLYPDYVQFLLRYILLYMILRFQSGSELNYNINLCMFILHGIWSFLCEMSAFFKITRFHKFMFPSCRIRFCKRSCTNHFADQPKNVSSYCYGMSLMRFERTEHQLHL